MIGHRSQESEGVCDGGMISLKSCELHMIYGWMFCQFINHVRLARFSVNLNN